MATYKVRDSSTGKVVTFNWNGDAPPTDADMEEVFSATRQGPSQEPPPMAPVEGASPYEAGGMPTGAEVKKQTEPYGRAGLEIGGQIGGGLLGAAGGPPGVIAGETAGYVGGTYAGDLVYGPTDRSLGRRVAEGAAFSIAPRALFGAAEHLGKGAVRSALKIPPTQVKKKVADQVVDTIVKENMRVGLKGVRKGEAVIQDVERSLNDVLRSSTGRIDATVLSDAVEAQKARFADFSDPQAMYEALDGIKAKIMSHPKLQAGTISLADAQTLKKGLYKELKSFYKNTQALTPNAQMASNAESVGKAAWAESLRNNIVNDPTIPADAVNWLKREGNVINAMRWIERRANVGANMDPITFNDVLLGGLISDGMPAAIAIRFLRMPAVQSQIGIYMAKSAAARGPVQAGVIGAKNLLSQ